MKAQAAKREAQLKAEADRREAETRAQYEEEIRRMKKDLVPG